MASDKVYPPRRRYRVKWGVDSSRTVTGSEWKRACASGWIQPLPQTDGTISDRVARVVDGVFVRVVEGVIHLTDSLKREFYLHTSWKAIDAQAPMIRGEFWRNELQRQYANERPNPDADIVDRRGQFEGPYGVPVRI